MTDRFSGMAGSLTPGQFAPVADSQLEAWRFYGRRWGVALYMKYNESMGRDEWHLCCAGLELTGTEQDGFGPCGQTILKAHDGANPYAITAEQILDRVVAHIRNMHRKIEPVVYSGEYSRLA